MNVFIGNFFLIINVFATYCNSVSLYEQIADIVRRRQDGSGLGLLSRRLFGSNQEPPLIGVPSLVSHLPAAEPILPGHTLIRPSIGMLKSAVKFPHKDPDNGAWVDGNIDHLGIRYSGKNERVLYTGFRKMGDDYNIDTFLKKTRNRNKRKKQKKLIILVVPTSSTNSDEVSSIEEVSSDRQALRSGYYSDDIDMYENLLNQTKTKLFGKKNKVVAKNETSKLELLDNFNHIKISQSAPTYSEFGILKEPDVTDGLQQWWYYHQDDFKEFKD